MDSIHMDKVVTIIEAMKPGEKRAKIRGDIRYKDLSSALANYTEIDVRYPYGMRKTRVKALEAAGFKHSKTIWCDDTKDWGPVREIWTR